MANMATSSALGCFSRDLRAVDLYIIHSFLWRGSEGRQRCSSPAPPCTAASRSVDEVDAEEVQNQAAYHVICKRPVRGVSRMAFKMGGTKSALTSLETRTESRPCSPPRSGFSGTLA